MVPANLPRCYNSSDPELNSTAWIAEYIGPFLQFLSLEDFQAFGSAQVKLGFLFCPRTQPARNLQPLFLLFSAVHPGVHSQPGEHRSAQTDHLTAQPYQLLHSAGLPAGQQLQPHSVSFHFHILTNMYIKHVKEGKVMTLSPSVSLQSASAVSMCGSGFSIHSAESTGNRDGSLQPDHGLHRRGPTGTHTAWTFFFSPCRDLGTFSFSSL